MADTNGWEWLVGIAGLVLLVIFICKVLFWISALAFVMGIIWLLTCVISNNYDSINIPLIIIGTSIVIGLITFGIGYQFEESELGKPFVDLFKVVIETDDTINDIPVQVVTETIKAVNDSNVGQP